MSFVITQGYGSGQSGLGLVITQGYGAVSTLQPWNLFYGRRLPLQRKKRWPAWFKEKMNKVGAAIARSRYRPFVEYSDQELDSKWALYLLKVDDLMVQGTPLKDAEKDAFALVSEGEVFQLGL